VLVISCGRKRTSSEDKLGHRGFGTDPQRTGQGEDFLSYSGVHSASLILPSSAQPLMGSKRYQFKGSQLPVRAGGQAIFHANIRKPLAPVTTSGSSRLHPQAELILQVFGTCYSTGHPRNEGRRDHTPKSYSGGWLLHLDVQPRKPTVWVGLSLLSPCWTKPD
jgi:hypothetical protein